MPGARGVVLRHHDRLAAVARLEAQRDLPERSGAKSVRSVRCTANLSGAPTMSAGMLHEQLGRVGPERDRAARQLSFGRSRLLDSCPHPAARANRSAERETGQRGDRIECDASGPQKSVSPVSALERGALDDVFRRESRVGGLGLLVGADRVEPFDERGLALAIGRLRGTDAGTRVLPHSRAEGREAARRAPRRSRGLHGPPARCGAGARRCPPFAAPLRPRRPRPPRLSDPRGEEARSPARQSRRARRAGVRSCL